MHASLAADGDPRLSKTGCCVMDISRESSNSPQVEESARDAETKRAIRELLDVLPKDILDELNTGAIDLKDAAFLDGLVDHISRLAMASPRTGQKILPKIIKLKKLISRSLRESDPEVQVSATVTRTAARVGRNDTCPCGSGRKYKQCCLRKGQSA
jgi:SEC-C motif-containing protein